MENKKSLGIVGLVVLCLAVSALFGIAYATFNQDLTISGSATVSSSSWKVAWSAIAENTSTASGTLPTVSENGVTSISSWSASFTAPGQTYSFTVTAKNFGDYDAKLTGFTKGALTCAPATGQGAATTQEEADKVCNNMTLDVKLGGASSTTDLSSNGSSTTLHKNDTESYTFILSYNQNGSDSTGSSLPDGAVTVTVGTSTFAYTQQV